MERRELHDPKDREELRSRLRVGRNDNCENSDAYKKKIEVIMLHFLTSSIKLTFKTYTEIKI